MLLVAKRKMAKDPDRRFYWVLEEPETGRTLYGGILPDEGMIEYRFTTQKQAEQAIQHILRRPLKEDVLARTLEEAKLIATLRS